MKDAKTIKIALQKKANRYIDNLWEGRNSNRRHQHHSFLLYVAMTRPLHKLSILCLTRTIQPLYVTILEEQG